MNPYVEHIEPTNIAPTVDAIAVTLLKFIAKITAANNGTIANNGNTNPVNEERITKKIIVKIKNPFSLPLNLLLIFSTQASNAPVFFITPYNPPITANTTIYKANVRSVEAGIPNKSNKPTASIPLVVNFPSA